MESKEQFDNNLNFPKVLFFHINRILQSPTPEQRIDNIELLEDALFPYLDLEYKESIGNHGEEMRYVALLDPFMPGKGEMMGQKRTELARKKFRALMALAERKNLLLEKQSDSEEWNLPEEDGNADTTANVAEVPVID